MRGKQNLLVVLSVFPYTLDKRGIVFQLIKEPEHIDVIVQSKFKLLYFIFFNIRKA